MIGKKTVCIKFGNETNIGEHVSIDFLYNGQSVRLLGNFIDSILSDSLDCGYKRSMFMGYVNKLISKFGPLPPDILILI